MAETIRLLIDEGPVFEEVRVERCGTDRFRLLQSPGLVLGIAAGDLFDRLPDGKVVIIERGGNLSILIFAREQLDAIEAQATAKLGRLGARLDGRASKELVYTVAVEVGFAAIEKALGEIVTQFPKAEWYYGNVYDPADGVTPLDWWVRRP